MLRVCRTCLQKISDFNFVSLTDGIQSLQITNELSFCVPEMGLDTVSEAVMCTFCVDALHSAYDFKRQCLQTEERILNYIQNEQHLSTELIDLNNVRDFESKNTILKCDDFKHNSNLFDLESIENLKEELPFSNDADDYCKTTLECSQNLTSRSESDPSGINVQELTKYVKQEDEIDVIQNNDQEVEKPYQCNDCDYKSTEKSKLKRHLLTHNAVKPFKCTICNFETRRKDTLTIHMREHSGEKPYKCVYCDFKGVSKYALNMHCMQIHVKRKPFKCLKCSYSAVEQSTLRRHMTVHNKEKPFKCDQCNFSTAWKYSWTKHMQGHNGMTYKCDLCDYNTHYKHNLSLHLLRHSGNKPFKCNKCEYKAAEKSKLKRHILTHGSVKPFVCNICNYCTARSDTLKKHIMNHKRNQR